MSVVVCNDLIMREIIVCFERMPKKKTFWQKKLYVSFYDLMMREIIVWGHPNPLENWSQPSQDSTADISQGIFDEGQILYSGWFSLSKAN